MRHTADHRTQPELAYVCDQVCQLREPGQRIAVARHVLQEISPIFHNDCRWDPAERVLSNIIGSKYTLSFWVNPETGDVTFERHLDTGVTRYKEPDDDVRLSRIKARREYTNGEPK